jgi:hypothetical protein
MCKTLEINRAYNSPLLWLFPKMRKMSKIRTCCLWGWGKLQECAVCSTEAPSHRAYSRKAGRCLAPLPLSAIILASPFLWTYLSLTICFTLWERSSSTTKSKEIFTYYSLSLKKTQPSRECDPSYNNESRLPLVQIRCFRRDLRLNFFLTKGVPPTKNIKI